MYVHLITFEGENTAYEYNSKSNVCEKFKIGEIDFIFISYSFFNVLFGFHDILSNHPFPVVPFLFCIIAYFLCFVRRFSKKVLSDFALNVMR